MRTTKEKENAGTRYVGTTNNNGKRVFSIRGATKKKTENVDTV